MNLFESRRGNIDEIMESNRAIAEALIEVAEELWIPVVESRIIVYLNRTIDSFSDSWIHLPCRFLNKTQMKELIEYFHIPQQFTLSNRSVCSGEEALLVTLFKLAFPERLIDLEGTFGRDYSHWSRVINEFMDYIIKYWSYLLFDNMSFWKKYIPECANVIKRKMIEIGFQYPEELIGVDIDITYRVFASIDDTISPTCRVGSGPATRGINARRKDPDIQRAFYTGWKKLHGLKFQTVCLPNGMDFHVFGPLSARRPDSFSLISSKLVPRLALLMNDMDVKYCCFGDSAYSRETYITTYKSGDNLTEWQIQENACFTSIREPHEWSYRDLKNYWKALDYRRILQVQSMKVGHMFLTAMILKNAYTCFNGNEASEYFNYKGPSLEEWTSAGPRECSESFRMNLFAEETEALDEILETELDSML